MRKRKKVGFKCFQLENPEVEKRSVHKPNKIRRRVAGHPVYSKFDFLIFQVLGSFKSTASLGKILLSAVPEGKTCIQILIICAFISRNTRFLISSLFTIASVVVLAVLVRTENEKKNLRLEVPRGDV